MAEALKEMDGPAARPEELWMACASSVLPVPVSPSKTTGTSEFAARLARLTQRAMAALLVPRSSTFSLVRCGWCINCECLRGAAESVRTRIQSSCDCPHESALHLSCLAGERAGGGLVCLPRRLARRSVGHRGR